jgi:hypothetical protein
MDWQLIALHIFVGGAIIAVGLASIRLWQVSEAKQSTFREVQRKFAGISILVVDGKAYFRGLDRSWDERWRGNGVLLATAEMIYFRLWQRDLDLAIPCDRILGVEIRAQHARKTLHRQELLVTYRGSDGTSRAATFRVAHPGRWAQAIQEMLTKKACSTLASAG